MKKIFSLFVLLLLIVPFCFATQSSTDKEVINNNIKDLQYKNANSEIQIEEKDQMFELRKDTLLDISDDLLIIIKGFMILVFDLVKILVLYVNMRLFLYLTLTILPKTFNALADGIAQGFVRYRK